VHISYRHDLVPGGIVGQESSILKEVHYSILEDTSHDTLYVQHAFMLHWRHLQNEGCIPKNHIVWIGGCSSQFKSVRAWYFVSQYPNFTNSTKNLGRCQLIWNFFATSHGKGEVE
jgi:hypothetical protein